MSKTHFYMLFATLILTSCKNQFLIRKYTSGKYLHFTNNSDRNVKTHNSYINFSSPYNDAVIRDCLLVTSSEKHIFTKQNKHVYKTLNYYSAATNSDTIYLKNSRTIAGKVSQISSYNVQYYETKGRFQSSLKSISTEEIEKIHFNSGSYEYFNSNHPYANPLLIDLTKNANDGVKKTGFAVFGYIITCIIGLTSLIGSSLFGILLLGIGIGGLFSIKLKHSNKKLLLMGIKLGKIIGAIYLSIILIAIFSFIITIVLF